MKISKSFASLIICFSFTSNAAGTNYNETDKLAASIEGSADQELYTVVIDHSRAAAKDGVDLSPSKAVLISDPEINTPILKIIPLAGLDLPFRTLSYEAADGRSKVIVTEAEFIAKRHGLNTEVLTDFTIALEKLMAGIDPKQMAYLDLTILEKGYGLKHYPSKYDYDTTYKRFKDEVLGENADMLWFGEIDYTADAEKFGVKLPKMKLLLFGAPGPGADAMRGFKTLGLDAFCQKVLMIEQDGKVSLYSNDLVDFAKLHTGDTMLQHRVINFRLNQAYKNITED